MFAFLFVIGYLLLIAGIVILQIFLSRRTTKWPGLVLPFISIIISLFIVLGLCTFTSIKNTKVVTQNQEGAVIKEYMENTKSVSEEMAKDDTLYQIIVVFFITNIPTLILLGIYKVCHEKEKVKLSVDDEPTVENVTNH